MRVPGYPEGRIANWTSGSTCPRHEKPLFRVAVWSTPRHPSCTSCTPRRERLGGGCDGVALREASPCGRSPPPVAKAGPPSAAAEQVDVRAHVRERIARGCDAIHPGDGV